jgi:hypothetical protein
MRRQNRVARILRDIPTLLRRETSIPAALTSCRIALRLTNKGNIRQYFAARLTYAECLARFANERLPEYYEQAIRLLIRLEKALPKNEPVMRANCRLCIGWYYISRISGNRINNLLKAKKWYLGGMKLLVRNKAPLDWALARTSLAQIAAELAILDIDRKANLRAGLKAIKEAIEVYKQQRRADDTRYYHRCYVWFQSALVASSGTLRPYLDRGGGFLESVNEG